jgi:hypothetical protein
MNDMVEQGLGRMFNQVNIQQGEVWFLDMIAPPCANFSADTRRVADVSVDVK